MPTVQIHLNEEWEHRLKVKAATESRTKEELVLDAIRQYLQSSEHVGEPPMDDIYGPLRRMIGLVKGGPSDASVHHDLPEGENG